MKSSQSFSKISTQKKDITKDKFEAPPLPKYSQTISQRPLAIEKPKPIGGQNWLQSPIASSAKN